MNRVNPTPSKHPATSQSSKRTQQSPGFNSLPDSREHQDYLAYLKGTKLVAKPSTPAHITTSPRSKKDVKR
jgi:hypothetical protein